ncbi:MAG TPA: hypothetical protein VG328_04150 [Stellaceae bacterium]|nr:hypothetical protein [Stellaceae bacterium]
MAHENMEEWAHDASIEQETIRAVVEGFADGRIELPPVKKNIVRGQVRLAPSFKVEGDSASATASLDVGLQIPAARIIAFRFFAPSLIASSIESPRDAARWVSLPQEGPGFLRAREASEF